MLNLIAVLMLLAAPASTAAVYDSQSASRKLHKELVEFVRDDGMIVEIVVRCSPQSIGIMSYDKGSKLFQCSRNRTHKDFLNSWLSTCGFRQ